MYETAGNLEFKIEGKTYTLNGDKTPAWAKKEIRRRLLVSLATNINRTLDADGKKLFSKGEILNGLIIPVKDCDFRTVGWITRQEKQIPKYLY